MKNISMDNHRINALSVNQEVIKEFPFFNKKIEKKGCCNRKVSVQADHEFIRAVLSSLTIIQQIRLKELLKCDQITVYTQNPQGHTVPTTF